MPGPGRSRGDCAPCVPADPPLVEASSTEHAPWAIDPQMHSRGKHALIEFQHAAPDTDFGSLDPGLWGYLKTHDRTHSVGTDQDPPAHF